VVFNPPPWVSNTIESTHWNFLKNESLPANTTLAGAVKIWMVTAQPSHGIVRVRH
jgi:hypothetical protein